MKSTENQQPKKGPARVLEGLEAVKRAGTTNMFDWQVGGKVAKLSPAATEPLKL